MKLEDENRHPETLVDAEVKRVFEQQYLAGLSGPPPFLRMEKMQKDGQQCTDLITLTANLLSGRVVTLMLVAVQKDNLEMSINHAIKWAQDQLEGQGTRSTEAVIKQCLAAFPWMWYFVLHEFEEFLEEAQEVEVQEKQLNKIFTKLQYFVSKWPGRLSISHQHVHHSMIVTIIILEYACRLRASSPDSTPAKALDKAYSLYKQSGTHKAVKSQFPGSPNEYFTPQFTGFILRHRLDS